MSTIDGDPHHGVRRLRPTGDGPDSLDTEVVDSMRSQVPLAAHAGEAVPPSSRPVAGFCVKGMLLEGRQGHLP